MINVIGMGYIGLPTALMLAANNIKVIGTDCKESLIRKLQEHELTFEEQGLKEIFDKALQKGILFMREYQCCSMYVIAVPTPYLKKDKRVDASFIVNVVRDVLDICESETILIIESTMSPGTIDRYIRPLLLESDKVIHLVHAPERIIPGNMVYELEHNSRTIGADSREIGEEVKKIYSLFCKGDIIITDIRTAEMTKVVENTYRDINIAFANELAKICRFDHLNVYDIIKIANMHPRVNILQPGPGVGGHCISVDPWFLVGDYPGLANMVLAARKINDSMPEFVLERIAVIMEENHISEIGKVGIYGLTYKEDVDDLRESPTLQMMDCMKRHLAGGVKIYDPFVSRHIVEYQLEDFDEFLRQIEIVVIMVGHTHIRENMKKLSGKIVLDTRNICDLPNTYRL